LNVKDYDEKELIKSAKDGDVSAFEKIILKHQEKIYNFALFLVGNPHDAQEILQQALLKAYLSIKSFKGKSSFTTWLYRIVNNTFQDELKKSYKKHEVLIDTVPSTDLSLNLTQIIEKEEVKQIVRDAVRKLPLELSTIILLRDFQGFSYEEIAEIVKIPVGTVKSRLSRARFLLKDMLKGELF
jgi:RNA polymerase sigma-70 factor (ECF subfamily)